VTLKLLPRTKLAVELRRQIIEHALVEDSEVVVTKSHFLESK
jgi:hypothetical protein